MKTGWEKRFKAEILKALREGPKTTPQIYRILKRNCSEYCNNSEKCTHFKLTGVRQPEWQHKMRGVQHKMQEEFLIYLDKGIHTWKIAE
jgi:hypothetical protein